MKSEFGLAHLFVFVLAIAFAKMFGFRMLKTGRRNTSSFLCLPRHFPAGMRAISSFQLIVKRPAKARRVLRNVMKMRRPCGPFTLMYRFRLIITRQSG